MRTLIAAASKGGRKHQTWRIAVVSSIALACHFSICEAAQSPRVVVEHYCLLDAQGANYSSTNPGFNEMARLLINEDEAAYDVSEIVASYHVGKAIVHGQYASVPVTYLDLGIAPSEGELGPGPHLETVNFHLALVKGEWKIDGLRLMPHISKTWILAKYRRDAAIEGKQGKVDPGLADRIAKIGEW